MSDMTNDVPTSDVVEQTTSPFIDDTPVKLSRKNALAALLEGEIEFPSLDNDVFSMMLDKSMSAIKEDEMIRGSIRSMTKDDILVDIGFKSLGVIPRSEFSVAADSLQIGDEIDVFVDKLEDSMGRLILSRKRADFMKTWQDILGLHDRQEVVPVRILRRIKGGMVVDLLGIEAFLPGSQIDVRPVRDFDVWVGKTIDIRVVKVNNPSENVVVSHKVLLEEQLAEQRGKILLTLDKGLVLEGVVKAISDFGVFVDLGGVDGLVHITDLSWGRVNHPSEIVNLDTTVKVVVLDFDQDKKRISLGMKQLTPHPWDTIGEKYETTTKVEGKVVSITDYGVFIEIEKGIEGLIHISEMSWTQHIKHPSQMVSLGQSLEAIVLNIDKDNRKLALGMKQLEPDPWLDLMNKYPIDSVHKGVVRNLTNFGVFVELEPGVDGLVHISDLSWTKKIRHPGEFVKKGDELDVTVIAVDSDHRRISLGHKQITENPWEIFETRFSVGSEAEGKVVRIIDKGIIVEMPEGVDGFVPSSQLSFAPVRNITEYFQVGDTLPLKVLEFDKEAKKIVLSAIESLKGKDAEVIAAYIAAHPVPNAEKYANGGSTATPAATEAEAEVVVADEAPVAVEEAKEEVAVADTETSAPDTQVEVAQDSSEETQATEDNQEATS